MTDDEREDALTPGEAADDGILIYDAVLPETLVPPTTPFPNRIPQLQQCPVQPECTHQWKTCPVHSLPDGGLPPFSTVLTCVYGGVTTKAGTPWDQHDSDEVVRRIVP